LPGLHDILTHCRHTEVVAGEAENNEMTLSATNTVADAATVRNSVPTQVNGVRAGLLSLGLGPLGDADRAREFAQLQALHVSQQYSLRAITLADQAPQTLLSLFK
jgi:flagellin